MKGIIILFAEKDQKYNQIKSFNGKSGEELSIQWAENICSNKLIEGISEYKTVSASCLKDLLGQISDLCKNQNFDTVVLGFNNCPFLNIEITQKLVFSHVEYKSEYTFVDGYPYGFAPEVIHSGTVNILYELSKTSQKNLGEKPVTKTSLFDLIKTDINSFEVETLMAPKDWRLLRLNFDTLRKENYLACEALFEKVNGEVQKNIIDLSDIASKSPEIIKTVPGFYNIQISSKVNSNVIYAPYENFAKEDGFSAEDLMNLDNFNSLVDKIAAFSETAVISLSAWGEAFSNSNLLLFIEKILSYKGLSVFIETDGLNISDDFCEKIRELIEKTPARNNGWEKVMIAVSVDAFSKNVYGKIHENCNEMDFEKSVNAISKLRNAVGNNVYPQFTRMNQNEEELENFFRYWKEASNPSGGQLIIQKYNDFSGRIPMCKPADLSPVDRDPCWHLRRDMTILINGDVPVCRQCCFKHIIGNVFKENLEEIWTRNNDVLSQHMNKKYEGLCEKCDEFYTFNF